MKNYLNKDEKDNWLLAMCSTLYIEKIMTVWQNNLTSEERKKLKTSMTMTKNALKSIADRMPAHEKKKLINHSKTYQIRILTNEGARILEKRTKEEVNTLLSIAEQELLITDLISIKCAECTAKCNECITYKILENTLMPKHYAQDNCPYAFSMKKETDNELYSEIKKLNKHHKKISARKMKKIKNRFDEE